MESLISIFDEASLPGSKDGNGFVVTGMEFELDVGAPNSMDTDIVSNCLTTDDLDTGVYPCEIILEWWSDSDTASGTL